MARKGHRKSRLGCNECKRRHVKCDETRPRCRKCILSERDCDYEAITRAQSSTEPSELGIQHQYANPHTPEILSNPVASVGILRQVESPRTPSTLAITADINVDHLELLYNYEHETCKTVARNEEQINTFRRLIIQHAFERPFLLRAILALSALHLSLQRPSRASSYRNVATILQSQALQDFYLIFPHRIDDTNALDTLLFQHVIGLHVFCDIFASVDENFSEFLERLVGCIRLLRGIESVINRWWDTLSRSELGGIMLSSHVHQQQTLHQSQKECQKLSTLIAEADLRPESITVCQDSVSYLQSYLDSEHALDEAYAKSTHMLFAWLVTLSPEFIDLLDQRRPEALIILAHYAVLLDRRKQSWVVGNAGEHLLRHINSYLGQRWKDWLEWPNSVVSSTPGGITSLGA